MRVIFVGAVDFSQHCLNVLLNTSVEIVAVLTLRKEKAGFHSDYFDLGDVAQKNKIPLYRIDNINDQKTVETIKDLKPDIIFVFGWSQIISNEILKIPPRGVVGTHPTLLPKNRGRHPVIWALVEGLEESGLTFFYMTEKADAGDILWQKPFPISFEDDASTVLEKIKSLAEDAIPFFVDQFEKERESRQPQDHSKATYRRKRTEADGEIFWNNPRKTIYNLVRALTFPYVGAHTYISGQKMLIWRCSFAEKTEKGSKSVPGLIERVEKDGTFLIWAKDGPLKILKYEIKGQTAIRKDIILGEKL